jgi:glycosyltransferase involved in cell wall biosynthesis
VANRLFITCFTGNSGLTDYSVSLARSISNNLKIRLITANSLLVRFTNLGFETNLLFRRSRHYFVDFPKFALEVLREKPDCVLCQGPLKIPLLEGALVSFFRYRGVQTALTIHDVLPHYPRFWSKFEFGWYYQRFDKLIVHSLSSEVAVRELGVTRPILVVPHGAYDLFRLTDQTARQARSKFSALSEEDFVVLFFGHLEPRKGLMEFIAAASRMSNQEKIKFVIAGGNDMHKHGPEYAHALSTAKGMPNMVVHDTRIPFEEVENYFLASDLVALPYLEGTTSGVLKLAIAFGLPVVASRVGDLPEEVPVGGGILFDAGAGLTDRLQTAIEQAQKSHAAMSDAMRLQRDRDSWPSIADAYSKFLFPEDGVSVKTSKH